MIDYFRSFTSLFKLDTIQTDNDVFRLHYKFTVIMLSIFSLLLTSKQYFGEPIECQVGAGKVTVVEAYCWIYGTYINRETLAAEYGVPGLGPQRKSTKPWDKSSNEDVIWQQYYQWVSIVFCLQALLFYLPRYLWKIWEGGRLKLLVGNLNSPLVTSTWNNSVKNQVVNYILTGRRYHKLYAWRYSFCEVLNLVNVILQIFLMNLFLGGQFYLYGLKLLTSVEDNPMEQVFPKLTKCVYYNYGPSGSLQNYDALCVLSLNILNEKLFTVLWFWLIFLTFVTILSLVYRFLVVLFPQFRMLLLMAQTKSLGSKQAKHIISLLSYGDFFLLYHLGNNINPIIYGELIMAIYDAIKNKAHCSAHPRIEVLH